jgi:hypothetical protein
MSHKLYDFALDPVKTFLFFNSAQYQYAVATVRMFSWDTRATDGLYLCEDAQTDRQTDRQMISGLMKNGHKDEGLSLFHGTYMKY